MTKITYTAIYTSEAAVEALTQVDITVSSKPTTAQLLDWIEEVEQGIMEKAIGSYAVADQYVDVPNTDITAGFWTAEWTPKTDSLRFKYGGTGIFVPLNNVKNPIISITSLYKNDKDYSEAASWTQLTEGPANNSSFILLTSKTRGYALYFYDNFPVAGPKRLKMSYNFGYNVDSKILRRYCTLDVAVKVLEVRMGTSSADGLVEFQSGTFGSYIPTQYEKRINIFKAEMLDLEKRYFPKKELPMGLI